MAAESSLKLPEAPDASGRLVVAFSGGLDSTVLLHALAKQSQSRLLAVHVHHGLQAAADAWAAHCEGFAKTLGVAFELCKVAIEPNAVEGPEAAARAARYAALAAVMRPGDLLATAHHREDQAETVLLRLLRGTGVDGLAAMRRLVPFPPGRLWRPLLALPRGALRAYAAAHRLSWIEDPHNADPRYARSWLRGAVLPVVRGRFPQADSALTRTARLAAEAAELHEALAEIDLAATSDGDALSISALHALSPARRHNLIRHWLRGAGLPLPDESMMARIEAEVLVAAPDAEPLLAWPGVELRRYRDRLHAMAPLPEVVAGWRLAWTDSPRCDLPPGCGELVAENPPPTMLVVRQARDGERLRAAPSAPSRTLKNLFQEAGIPSWLRRRVPVLELAGEVVWVPGVFLREAWRAEMRVAGWRAEWRHRLHGTSAAHSF